MRVVGVDGTRGGWVAIVLEDGRFACDLLVDRVESTFEELGPADAIGIDVPIGFGTRAADAAARAFLRGSASSVFAIPSRDVLAQPFRAGLGVSAQAHALGPRLLHVTARAAAHARLYEGHPEVSSRSTTCSTRRPPPGARPGSRRARRGRCPTRPSGSTAARSRSGTDGLLAA